MLLENIQPSDNLDSITETFSKDRQFFDALTQSPAFSHLCKIIVYTKWWRKWHLAFLDGLLNAIGERFPAQLQESARIATTMLAIQLTKDVGLTAYLISRGLAQDAGVGQRRMFENIGVMSHFWNEPPKVALVSTPESSDYRRAFVFEEDRQKQAVLKSCGISKRFAAVDGSFAPGMTTLYALLSDYLIHGGTGKHNVGISVERGPFCCFFLPRPSPDDSMFTTIVEILEKGVEMVTVEYALLVGKVGKKTPDVMEGGVTLNRMMGTPGEERSRMSEEITAVRRELIGENHSRN